MFVQGEYCKRGACSKWASGLSLAAEQSIEVGSRSMDMAFYKLHSFDEGHVQSGRVSFPFFPNKALAGVKTMDWTFVQGGLC